MQDEFLQQVDQWVQDALSRRIASFDNLLQFLPGIYPTLVIESLERLAADPIPNSTALDLLSSATRASANCHYYQDDCLPVPHPLDYDWRFEPEACSHLIEKCVYLSNQRDTLALLGTPTLAQKISRQSHKREWVLFDANRDVIDVLSRQLAPRTVQLDVVSDPIPTLGASVVVADPPWYLDYIKLFLWAASHLVRPGGYILLSAPPVGTRPGIVNERLDLIEWTKAAGLELLDYKEAVLPYTTPPFEHNALRVAGLPSVPTSWRHGDLATFQCCRKVAVARPAIPIEWGKWSNISIDGVHIRVLESVQQSVFADPTLESIVPFDILPTVSRRDERRKRANIWTSGNRIFSCGGNHIFKTILQTLQNGQPLQNTMSNSLQRPLMDAETQLIERASQQVRGIIACEQLEYLLPRRCNA